MANLIGAPRPHHQTEEAGPTGDYTENDNKAAATPSEAHPEMDTRRLVQREDAQTNRKQELVERAPKGLTKQLKSRCAGRTGNRRT